MGNLRRWAIAVVLLASASGPVACVSSEGAKPPARAPVSVTLARHPLPLAAGDAFIFWIAFDHAYSPTHISALVSQDEFSVVLQRGGEGDLLYRGVMVDTLASVRAVSRTLQAIERAAAATPDVLRRTAISLPKPYPQHNGRYGMRAPYDAPGAIPQPATGVRCHVSLRQHRLPDVPHTEYVVTQPGVSLPGGKALEGGDLTSDVARKLRAGVRVFGLLVEDATISAQRLDRIIIDFEKAAASESTTVDLYLVVPTFDEEGRATTPAAAIVRADK